MITSSRTELGARLCRTLKTRTRAGCAMLSPPKQPQQHYPTAAI